ncbi:MAG: aspartate carbamoyltransferase catalytic subunit [Fimbriimonadaceae bacterium]
MRQLLAIRYLERPDIENILVRAADHRERIRDRKGQSERSDLSVGLLFFEDSTRTRVSFEQAAAYLGHRTVSFTAAGSSLRKGETLRDTVLTIRNEGLDAIVVRHPSSGASNLAAREFGGPCVNAGDGSHEHPTQALGDALTIRDRKGDIEGLTVAIVGDVLHSRVARSNAWLLSKLGATVRLCGPSSLMPSQMTKLPGAHFYDVREAVHGADVVMCLRLQRERMAEGLAGSVSDYANNYQVNRRLLARHAPDAIVMHPGPLNRGVEIDDLTADGPSSAIADQVRNSVFVRMAVLDWCFDEAAA